MSNQQFPLMLSGLFLAIGLGSAGFFVSQTIFNGKVAINTAEAKGLVTRTVSADQVNWVLAYTVQQKESSDLSELYKQARISQQPTTTGGCKASVDGANHYQQSASIQSGKSAC